MTIKGDYIDHEYVIEYKDVEVMLPEYTVDLSNSRSHQMIMETLAPAMSSGTIQYNFYASTGLGVLAEGVYNYQITDGKILLSTVIEDTDTYLMIDETGQFFIYSSGTWKPIVQTEEELIDPEIMNYNYFVYEAFEALIGYRGQYVRGGWVEIQNNAYLFNISAVADNEIRYLMDCSHAFMVDIHIFVATTLPTEW